MTFGFSRNFSFFARRKKEKELEAAYRNMVVEFQKGAEPSPEITNALKEIHEGIKKAQIESFENQNVFKLIGTGIILGKCL